MSAEDSPPWWLAPPDPERTPGVLARALRDDRWLVVGDPHQLRALGRGGDAGFPPLVAAPEHPPGEPPPPPWTGGVVLATSGTLGVPRWVRLDGAALWAAASMAVDHFQLGRGEGWVSALPPWRIGGLTALTRAWRANGRWAISDRPGDSSALWHTLHTRRATHLSLVPAQLAGLLPLGPPPPGLRLVVVGGGRLSRELALNALHHGWPLWSAYGLSEAGGTVSAGPLLRTELEAGSPVHQGTPLPGWRVGLSDRGEIELEGPPLCRGPVGGPPLSRPFPTGDRGRWDGLGRLHLLGRCDERLESGGWAIDPGELEDLLESAPGVEAALVAGVEDPHWGQRIGALVVGGGISLDQLGEWCARRLESPWRPRLWRVVERLPLTPAGKPDRARAAQWLQSAPDPTPGAAPPGSRNGGPIAGERPLTAHPPGNGHHGSKNP